VYDLVGHFTSDGSMVLKKSLDGKYAHDLKLSYVTDPKYILWKGLMTDPEGKTSLKVSFRRQK
jgi:hypothetical protein